MLDRISGLNKTQFLIAIKSTFAILLGYAVSLRLDWNASDVATTIIVLQTATLGATLKKGTLRLAGTLIGAVVGFAIVASCSHSRELFVLAMSITTGVCVYGMQASKYQYAWLLVVVTSAVVGWPTAMAPNSFFETSVNRVTAVLFGIFSEWGYSLNLLANNCV